MSLLPLASELNSGAEIVELWKGFRKQVLECISKTPDSEFQNRPELGGWSISEIAEHIYLSQFTIVRAVPVVLAGKVGFDSDEQADLDLRKMRISLSKPTGFKNPEAVSPLSNYKKEEVLPLLEKSEKKMIDSLQNRTKVELQKRGLEHPAFGKLNLFNYTWAMSLHENMHLGAMKQKTEKF
ncbi:MAG: DinB family protein [Leptospiraceae bacterium]|nr:DinB family protein [Leptospiraceae bacterium]